MLTSEQVNPLYIFSAKQGFSPLLPEKTLKSRLNCDITSPLVFLHQATKQNNPDDRYWKNKDYITGVLLTL